MDENSVNIIKTWLQVETQISEYSTLLRELRKKKKELNVELLEIMKTNNVECFDCNSGQITYTRNNVKKSLNKKVLHEILSGYFTNAPAGEAEKLCEYIQQNRGTETRESVKLKKNKI